MKPITYTAAQVARMIHFARFFDPSFGAAPWSESQVRLMACGRMKPTGTVLAKFNLCLKGNHYVWNLQ